MADLDSLEQIDVDVFDTLHSYIKFCVEELGENTDCWIWQFNKVGGSPINGGDYGAITYKRKRLLVHRFAYELRYGEISKGLQIDHLCRIRACWNPKHLEAVSTQVNQLRSSQTQKTHCNAGHLIDQYYKHKGVLRRRCSTCHRYFSNRRNELKRQNS